MRNAYDAVLKLAADHPLIAIGLLSFLGIALLLGALHEIELIGDFLVAGIRQGKHALLRIGAVGRKLRRELTTWKETEE